MYVSLKTSVEVHHFLDGSSVRINLSSTIHYVACCCRA